MSLPDWERNGWVVKHRTSRHEICDVLHVVGRDLADSAAEGLSADWRMNIAYNAALRNEKDHAALDKAVRKGKVQAVFEEAR